MKSFVISKRDAGTRVDRFIDKTFENLPKSLMYKEIRKKNIKVNKKRCTNDQKLKEGDLLELYLKDDVLKLKVKHLDFMRASDELDIVYEDEDLIVIDKPSGLMVVRMHITRKNEIYLYGNLNKQGCVWKYENGSMIPTVTFENIDGIYGVRFMTDDTICAMRLGYDAPDSCWIKKYDGTTVQRLDMVSDFLKNIGSDAKKVTNLMYHYACGNENVFYVIGSANAERDDIKEYINFILAYEYDGKEIVSHTVWSQAQPK